jgi:hypothetical protein
MPQKWPVNDGTFHLGINMAGAVSAGAYTAGVLDFLIEAIDEWYKAKAFPNPSVPMHDLTIEAFSGASAGGMCAAIAAAMVQGPFEHIHDPTVVGTTNKFYESWVNRIDIEWLLGRKDLGPKKPVISLLDSSIIDEIADYALTPGPASVRPGYVSESLTLFLTLTNVRGTPFPLSGDAQGSAEETIRYYADRLQFETVSSPNGKPLFPLAKPLPIGSSGGAWPLLKEAAKATGAFPLFLAPRKIDRAAADYFNSPWAPLSDPLPEEVRPDWPLDRDANIATLNVDGGVTDNNPFQLAHDYLAIHNPLAYPGNCGDGLHNPRGQNEANCAVLTVAPFPAHDLYDEAYNFDENSSILGMLPNLMTALISQSRFQGESLTSVIDTRSYSRFVLAPSDSQNPGKDALQCSLLGAFGGFFERGFRAHDYQLGRRNCQRFLEKTFRLTVDNPLMAAGLQKVEDRESVIGDFAFDQPGTLPIIPLCGSAQPEVPNPEHATIAANRVDRIVDWVVKRLQAVSGPLLSTVTKHEWEKVAAEAFVNKLIADRGRARIAEILQAKLQGVIQE